MENTLEQIEHLQSQVAALSARCTALEASLLTISQQQTEERAALVRSVIDELGKQIRRGNAANVKYGDIPPESLTRT